MGPALVLNQDLGVRDGGMYTYEVTTSEGTASANFMVNVIGMLCERCVHMCVHGQQYSCSYE